jgi:hypothetical protein
MSLSGDDHTSLEIDNMTSDRFDDSDEFVTNRHRRRNGALRPGIPFINVDIGPANRRTKNSDQNIKLAYSWNRDLFQPKPGATFSFHERLHLSHRKSGSPCELVTSLGENFSQVSEGSSLCHDGAPQQQGRAKTSASSVEPLRLSRWFGARHGIMRAKAGAFVYFAAVVQTNMLMSHSCGS